MRHIHPPGWSETGNVFLIPSNANLSSRKPRGGFTMIEILTVIGVIAVLAAVLSVAVMRFYTTGRQAATRASIDKIDKLLNQRFEAFSRINFNSKVREREPISGSTYLSLAGGDKRRAGILVRKYFMKQYFPQYWGTGEAVVPTGFTNTSSAADSSEVLYYLLTKGDVLGFSPVGREEFKTDEVADTDDDDLLEFVDAWGKPLRFYRWPTRLLRSAGSITGPIDVNDYQLSRLLNPELPGSAAQSQALSQDPEDPAGVCNAPTWLSSSAFESTFHTLQTYHWMLIVSGGEDEETGLFEPNSTVNFGYLARIDPSLTAKLNDNISNTNSRLKAQ